MRPKGFSLIEYLLVLSITSMLLYVGVSSYRQVLMTHQKNQLVDDIKRIVQYSKTVALEKGHSVYLEPIDAKGDWSYGVQLVHGVYPEREILHQWAWSKQYWSVTWRGMDAGRNLTFSEEVNEAKSNGTFTLRNTVDNECVSLILNRLGRLRIAKGSGLTKNPNRFVRKYF